MKSSQLCSKHYCCESRYSVQWKFIASTNNNQISSKMEFMSVMLPFWLYLKCRCVYCWRHASIYGKQTIFQPISKSPELVSKLSLFTLQSYMKMLQQKTFTKKQYYYVNGSFQINTSCRRVHWKWTKDSMSHYCVAHLNVYHPMFFLIIVCRGKIMFLFCYSKQLSCFRFSVRNFW